jgi:peptide/nickel transport system ATP-binding protein
LLQEVKLLPSDEDLQQQYRDQWQKTHPDKVLSDRDLSKQVSEHKHAILQRYPHELSGGQIQRIMIAMAICCNPSLLIADEPTTALDVTVQARTLELLRELRDRRGMSIIFITHDLSIIAEIADWVAVMYQGKIVEYGSVWDIFSNPQHPYTKGLLACRPQPDRCLQYLPTIADFMEVTMDSNGEMVIQEKELSVEQALRINSERSTADSSQRTADLEQNPPLLSVEDLQVNYPIRGIFGRAQRYVMAVNGVSFQVYPGETLGLVGESGCGKTTLARTLLRLVRPTRGKIVFEGIDIAPLSNNRLRQFRRNMQIIFQDPFSSLDPRMTIQEAITEPLKIHGINMSRRNRAERVEYLLDRVGIDPKWANRYPHEFSGGQRQRVCIARALALNPKFIICDESVSALDVSVQAQVLNLLKELQQEFNLTYIFISHDLSVVKFMSDRIVVMNRGKIEEVGPAESIYRTPQQPYTQQLIAAIPKGSLDSIRDRQTQRGFLVS